MNFGLALEKKGQEYLKNKYGLCCVESVGGIPIFTKDEREYFVGGHKGIYTILQGDPTKTLQELKLWRKKKKMVHYVFSTQQNIFWSKRVDSILIIPPGMSKENRFAMYRVNARNQIRQAGKTSLRYLIEPPPPGWYALYCRSMERLGTVPRQQSWFAALEHVFATSVQCVTAYDNDSLIGALYMLTSDRYMSVPFAVSEKQYWHMRINNGLWDRAIIFAIEHGIQMVDFGQSMAYDKSHLHMKACFGAKEYYCADAYFCNPVMRTVVTAKNFHRRLRNLLQRTFTIRFRRPSGK